MGTTLISACYGGWDAPRPAPIIPGVDSCVMVTPRLGGNTERLTLKALGWTVIESDHLPDAHPCLRAKVPKFQPWAFADGDRFIWLDASAEVLQPDGFVDWVFADPDADLTLYAHPHRVDIRDEARASQQPKYAGQPLEAQVAWYMGQSMTPEAPTGLYATGLLGWRPTNRSRALGAVWLAECQEWSWQDQISLPHLLARHPMMIVSCLEGVQYTDQRVIWHPHQGERG